MLNKNQSKKSNSWKYALVLPVLIAFVIFFQVKVIAQEKSSPITESRNKEVVKVVIDKNTSDQEMKKDAELLKKDYGVTLTTSKVKRNSKGEITAINVTFNDHKGSNGTHVIDGDEPISPIMFSLKRDKNGKGQIGFYDMSYNSEDEVDGITEVADVDFPTPPIPPTPPVHPYQDMMDAPNAPALPEFPEAPEFPSDINNEKAMAQYEKSMVTFERKMKKAEKEFESKMEVFERNMNENDPKMKTFEREMEKFEVEMERFQDQLEDRLERDIEIRVEKNINKDGKISQKHMRKAQKEAMKAREEATEAREEATRDREEAMRDREEAMRDREEANKIRKEIRKEVRKTE